MIKQEFDNLHNISIDAAKQNLIDHFPEFTIKDYSTNGIWIIKKGLQKHEIKIYTEKIFINSMIDANSSKISFPIMLFFIVSFILNQWILKKQGVDLLIPIFISVLLSFMFVPAVINLFSVRFRIQLKQTHDQLIELFR